MISRYVGGESASALARSHGISTWQVLNRLRVANVRIRSSSEAVERRLDVKDPSALIALVDGLVLGDGAFDAKGYFRIDQGTARIGFLDTVAGALESFGCDSKRLSLPPRDRPVEGRTAHYNGGQLLYTPSYLEFRELRARWYPKGIKRVPSDLVLTPQGVAFWFCGDGTYCKSGTLTFCTQAFTKKEVQRLAGALGAFGIVARCVPLTRGKHRIWISDKEEALKLKALVWDFVPECCRYKFRYCRAPKKDFVRIPAKFDRETVREIRAVTNESRASLARRFGSSYSTIAMVLDRRGVYNFEVD